MEEPLSPVVFHIHGGGWKRGSKDLAFYGSPFIASSFAKHGYVSVAPNYTLGNYPNNIMDCARAIRWTIENIEDYGGDPTRIYISGHSAGAHLATLLTLKITYLEQEGIDLRIIKGVLAISGVYDLQNPTRVGWRDNMYRYTYLYPSFGKNVDVIREASPLFNIQENMNYPPIIVMNADGFDLNLEKVSELFSEALLNSGYVSEYLEIKGTNHATVTRSNIVIRSAIDFFNRQLSIK
eukprot:TRINITY_DN958_c0_g2_i1.p1 TRINITY_DN958_c0_g2~~TRINITY_DN958_c0_g2_i1.p1  ORF type:complete len:237 (-),score=36.00 TRINITY_DN958_c0_g2_i1:15-725(-)